MLICHNYNTLSRDNKSYWQQFSELMRTARRLPGQIRTYSVVDSMNGVPRPLTREDNVWINKRTQARRPARRLVFVDVGKATPESFAVHYDKEQWWASPPVRHAKGTNVSFADGHYEYWGWKARETVKLGERSDSFHINIVPQTPDGKEDLHRLQEAVWGRLGYTPSSLSKLYLWVKSFQFNPGIGCGKLPIDTLL